MFLRLNPTSEIKKTNRQMCPLDRETNMADSEKKG